MLFIFGTFEKTKGHDSIVLANMLNFILHYRYSLLFDNHPYFFSVNCLFHATALFLLKSVFRIE